MPSIWKESVVDAVSLHRRMKLARMAPAMPTVPVDGVVARGTSVGAVVAAAPTMGKKTSTIVSGNAADQRSRGSPADGTGFEGMVIGDVGNAVESIRFSIGRLRRKHYPGC